MYIKKKSFKTFLSLLVVIGLSLFILSEHSYCQETENTQSIRVDNYSATSPAYNAASRIENKEKTWMLSLSLGMLDGLTFNIEKKFSLGKSNNILFKDSHISLGYMANVNQSNFSTGPVLRISPIAIFDVTISARYVYEWFGLDFNKVTDSIEGDIISDRISDGKYKAGQGILFTVMPMLKFKIGPVLITHIFILHYLNMNHGKVYFNSFYGHLQTDGFNYLNSTSIGFFLSEKVIIGLSASFTKAREAGYHDHLLSFVFLVHQFKGISNSDKFMFMAHWVYKSRNKQNDFITSLKGFRLDVSYEISFNW